MQFIGVRGSGEHSGFGRTVGSVLSNVNAQQSGVGNQTVNYWAVDVRPWEPKWFPNYVNSVKQGVTNLGNAVDHFRAACAGHPIVLAGYSQGAEVIDHYLRSGRNRGGVVGVALLGDPRFTPANGQPVNQGTYNRRLDGVSPSYFLRVGQFGGSERYPTDRRNWLRSYCANGDQICNTSSMVALTLCHERFNCAHMHYPDLRIGGVAYTRSAANFLLGRARRAMPGTSTPPTNDTQEPTSDNPPSTQQDPASASGVSETVGGAANTWTNYTNAGGAQGPTIPTGTTVTIACKVPGFRVADGNTWWYRIASAPWNGTYYASADAFYNNGATSGSLAGTPFVDPAVPDCAGSAPAPAPAPQPSSRQETTGGVTHTWTNYMNAGGTAGPVIPSNQTVTIACKVPGFRVADGNTWWYRIASAPWNGTYYASADAFYNNGATSGSLAGTPFVDPAVPDC